jgi:hypothetical protein
MYEGLSARIAFTASGMTPCTPKESSSKVALIKKSCDESCDQSCDESYDESYDEFQGKLIQDNTSSSNG